MQHAGCVRACHGRSFLNACARLSLLADGHAHVSSVATSSKLGRSAGSFAQQRSISALYESNVGGCERGTGERGGGRVQGRLDACVQGSLRGCCPAHLSIE